MASAKAPSLALSLRPIHTGKPENDELQSIVSRIHQQFGGFRHITEQKVKDDSADGDVMVIGDSKDDSTEDSEKPEDQKGTMEYVAAKRATMMRQLSVALNDTMMLLDFTSLLESHYLQKGEQTMSPYMKEKIPSGSLAFDKWEMPQPKKHKIEEARQTTNGWRADSLSSAADSLLDAANRLKQDVQKETKYWEQILTVKKEGWTVFRSPVARQQLGVQIASLEAGPLFKERGLVTFKSDKDGQIILKQPSATEPKMIRVRISRHGKIVGTSRGLLQDRITESNVPLQDQLQHARNSLFEEELFHEMRLESRVLLPYGVEVKSNTIAFSPAPQSSASNAAEVVMADLVPQWSEQSLSQLDESDELAQALSLSFRLLLSDYHRQRLRRRTALPPPLTERPQPVQGSSIVRSVLKMLRHHYAVQQLNDSLNSITNVLQSAGFPCVLQQTDSNIDQLLATHMRPGQEKPQLPTPLQATGASFLLGLPSSCIQSTDNRQSKYYLEISLITQFSGSRNGTSYSIRPPPPIVDKSSPQLFGRSKHLPAATFKALLSQILEYLTIDLISNVLAIKHLDWAPKGSDLWLESENEAKGSQKLALMARMLYDDGVVLEACREGVAGDGQKVEVVRWDGRTSDKKLLDVVAGWIEDGDSLGSN